jgi:hypothetical protein
MRHIGQITINAQAVAGALADIRSWLPVVDDRCGALAAGSRALVRMLFVELSYAMSKLRRWDVPQATYSWR